MPPATTDPKRVHPIYVFIPDKSVFRDAFNLKSSSPEQKSARKFFSLLATETIHTKYRYIRIPIELTLTLLNQVEFMRDVFIWNLLGNIMRVEQATTEQDMPEINEIPLYYSQLDDYKKPIVVSNCETDRYPLCKVLSTLEVIKNLENGVYSSSNLTED